MILQWAKDKSRKLLEIWEFLLRIHISPITQKNIITDMCLIYWCWIKNVFTLYRPKFSSVANSVRYCKTCVTPDSWNIWKKERYKRNSEKRACCLFHIFIKLLDVLKVSKCFKVDDTPNGRLPRKHWFSPLCVMI